ncbi:MAG: DUF4097 family beta strand repeat protein [Deltaproteobacteria bacterium]|nr:DUF4097 family beta strand repeat protein [Deltaproteobacteria bacterium]
MKRSKRYIALLAILTIVVCFPSLGWAWTEEKIVETYPLESTGKVYLENISGDITVSSWDKNGIEITATKRGRRERDFDDVTIHIRQIDGNIRIITRHDREFSLFRSGAVSVFYEIIVPAKASVRVKSISGNVEVRKIGGFLNVETISGEIRVRLAESNVRCKSTSGDIDMEYIHGDAELESVSGEISIQEIQGSIEAGTVSGDIELDAFSYAEEIEMSSTSGDVKLRGELSPGGIYRLDLFSGNTKVIIPSDSNFEFSAKTFSGSIECDFELKMSGRLNPRQVQGTVGKGGASINISSFSGNIRIIKQ